MIRVIFTLSSFKSENVTNLPLNIKTAVPKVPDTVVLCQKNKLVVRIFVYKE